MEQSVTPFFLKASDQPQKTRTVKNIKIIQSCLIGGNHVEAGTVLKDVDTRTAADLVGSGRAVDVTRVPKDESAITHRDPEAQDRDPKPAKKSGKIKEDPTSDAPQSGE